MSQPAPCPACAAQRVHTPEEWQQFHPFAHHGYVREHGWTHPALATQEAPRA